MQEIFELLRGTAAEVRRDPVAAAMGMLPLVGLGMWGDLGGVETMRLSFLTLSMTAFVLQYVLTRRAMRAGGLLSNAAPGKAAAFFGLCVLADLGILLGFTLLIVPGIWLYARWIAAGPILFAEGMTVSEALANSAERTRPLLGAIMGAACILYLPFVAGFGASIVAEEAGIWSAWAWMAIHLGLTVSQIAGWYLAVAVYRAVKGEPLNDVFA